VYPNQGDPYGFGTVRVFRQKFALEDAIEFHAFAPLEALPCVRPMAFLSSVHYLLPLPPYNPSKHRRAAAAGSITMNPVAVLVTSHNTEGLRLRPTDPVDPAVAFFGGIGVQCTVLFPLQQPAPLSNRISGWQ
jgi:hypothetical protein